MFGLSKSLSRIAIAAIAVILVLGFLQVRSCQQARQQAVQSKVDRSQGDAMRNSAADAVNTVGGVAANQMAGEDLTRQNERNIRDAKGADQGVDPAVRDAGLASLCRRQSFRNGRTGRLRCTPSGGVAPAS
jgi:ABC-type protease/lipase transport system fused ATPase/permease subunit